MQCGTRSDPNIALYFNGYTYRYYLCVSGSDIVTASVPLADIPEDDWKDHLQFSQNTGSSYGGESTDSSTMPNMEETEATAVQEMASRADMRSSGDSGIHSSSEDVPTDSSTESNVVEMKTLENGPSEPADHNPPNTPE